MPAPAPPGRRDGGRSRRLGARAHAARGEPGPRTSAAVSLPRVGGARRPVAHPRPRRGRGGRDQARARPRPAGGGAGFTWFIAIGHGTAAEGRVRARQARRRRGGGSGLTGCPSHNGRSAATGLGADLARDRRASPWRRRAGRPPVGRRRGGARTREPWRCGAGARGLGAQAQADGPAFEAGREAGRRLSLEQAMDEELAQRAT